MNYLFCVLIFIAFSRADGGIFDRFSGKKLDLAQAKELRSKNATERCSIEIKTCSPHEGSRVDGTCNNYKHPSRGAAEGPYLRLLKPDYGNKSNIRMDKHGGPLPSARRVRTLLQTTGRVDKSRFTVATAHYLEFIHRDVSFLNASKDFLENRKYCCQEAGKSDPHCIPIRVPKDDPYLKVTDIRCLNFSRAQTFQESGCTPEIIPPEQINFQTPLLDLSTIYGVDDDALAKIRNGENGMLLLEKRKQSYVPLHINNFATVRTIEDADAKKSNDDETIKTKDTKSIKIKVDKLKKAIKEMENLVENTTLVSKMTTNITNSLKSEDVCIQNRDNETTCYQFGFPEAGNYGLRTTALGIFFMREHNRLADALHKINPCWKDDRLFKVARQINIATASNIFMYELLPLLLNFKNMQNYELVSDHVVHVTSYEEDMPPQVYAEYEIAMRYFHTLLDGRVKLYTESLHYKGEFSHSETLYRQDLIEQDKNFEEINRGTFFQSSAKIDDIQDPEISENFYGDLQKAHDLAAIDIQRGRNMGIRGYNDYRHLCGIKAVKQFDDLLDVMDVEKVEALKQLYGTVDDIDLLAGIMSENFIQGTFVGPILYCIMMKQLQIFRYSDRFWYERGDQFHSFSLGQLHEIRKTNMARLACDNAEGIKYIQPQAFLNIKPGNSPVHCTQISGPNLIKWRDNTCFKNKYSHEATHLPLSFISQGTETNFSSFFDDLLFYKPFFYKIFQSIVYYVFVKNNHNKGLYFRTITTRTFICMENCIYELCSEFHYVIKFRTSRNP